MTLADLAVTLRERALAVARQQVTLAWRTAYYHRIKHMPDLAGELAELQPGSDDRDVDEHGHMSEARTLRVWDMMKSSVMAWNTRLAGREA
jgi:hypothetical protein